MSTIPSKRTRRHISVRGQVQGVGFRPFVYRLARQLGLAGWVCNSSEGVVIEVQGSPQSVSDFLQRLPDEAPPLVHIDAIESEEIARVPLARSFSIRAGEPGPAGKRVTADTVVCRDCLAELFNPADRRYRYPFINCARCGPRYTITRRLPYERRNTTMADFVMCAACQGEYDTPSDRRFQAQPNACGICGPRVWLTDSTGEAERCDDVIEEAAARIKRGDVLAIKAMGGFHLMCDARSARTVASLRAAKSREEKPFAVMVANVESALAFAQVPPGARLALGSVERPVVLLAKAEGCDAQLAGVAPGLAQIGVMLPSTPLQYLLFHELAGRPAGTAWLSEPLPFALIATSANPGGEALVIRNDEALHRLSGVADAYVMYDREIVTRLDDSVIVVEEAVSGPAGSSGAPRFQFVRRARGYTPQAIALPDSGPSVLAVGGLLKSTLCLTRGDEAFVSQHIGDLDTPASCRLLEETAQRLMDLLEIEPEVVARDLHPDLFSSRFAIEFAARRGLPVVTVQHQQGHIAAVAAEHNVTGPLLGVGLDGSGLGADGHIWGGELLWVEGSGFRRIGHFRELPLPGGERAARDPWRMAAAVLYLLGRGSEIERRFKGPAVATVRQMLERGLNAPPASSCGRWFDAAAGLLGVRKVAAYEGQAAMLLQGLAECYGEIEPLEDGFRITPDFVLDLSPLFEYLADERDAQRGAALFHATLIQAVARWTLLAAEKESVNRVAVAGGCFINRLLSAGLRNELEAGGLAVLEAAQVPPNDGGLSLGQAWVARHALASAR